MSREKDTSQDDLNWEKPQDTRYHARPRPQQPRPRPRASRDDQLRRPRVRSEQPGSAEYRRARQSASPRDVSEDTLEQPGRRVPMQRRPVPPRDGQPTEPPIARRRQTRDFREEEERPYQQMPPRSPRPPPPITRQARDEAYSRSRQRPRQPLNQRDYADERYARTPMRREIDTEEAEYEAYEGPVRRSGTRVLTQPQRRTQPARRSAWSTLLVGCIGGIVALALVVGIGGYILLHTLQVSLPGLDIGTSTFTDKQQTIPLNITSSITQLQVQNNVGNISISDDSTISTGGTLSYVKQARATSSSAASAEFARIQVKAQPGNSTTCPQASCLIVSATAPVGSADSVDITIALPPQNPTPQFNLNSKTQTGNISVENFNGLLTLTDDTGNVTVKGGLLDAGSCLQTRIGSVTFAGTLETATAPAINPCVGNSITSPTSGSSQPWYSIKTGTGNLDVTLNSLSAHVNLDATIFNKGQFTSEYPVTIQNSNGSASYNGPLLPGTQPSAQLLLSVDTGNITLHKG